MALALLKFGNPVILQDKIVSPTNLTELRVQAWPVSWGYALLGLVLSLSASVFRWQRPPVWMSALPLAWLGWQGLAGLRTVNGALTLATLEHFAACVACFYVGLFALSRIADMRLFWLALLGGFFVVLVLGWEQHFGGLHRAREYFYKLPDWQSYPPEFLKKIQSNRIYSTLFYPNALAGVIILLLPMTLFELGKKAEHRRVAMRLCLAGLAAILATGCLYWSGSKAGWLIVLGQGGVAFFHCSWSRQSRLITVICVLLLGLAGFWMTYRDYFARGATSTTARFDYWRAAWQTLRANPVLGTGPGTFMISYKRLKAPESEMARLAHNDYLQQGSDSGAPGMLIYAVFVWGSIGLLYHSPGRGSVNRSSAVWLGVTGLAAQSLVEFGLYIPALAWPFFLFIGWLLGGTYLAKASTTGAALRTVRPLR
jgi:O-antigen ligase